MPKRCRKSLPPIAALMLALRHHGFEQPENEPPPRGVYSLLDRPLPGSGAEIAIDKIPQQLGQLLLFGKQTDRSVRLELARFRPEFPAAKRALIEILGDDIAVTSSEVVIGHLGEIEHALSWHWRLPDDTPEELRYKLALESAAPRFSKLGRGCRNPHLAAAPPNRRPPSRNIAIGCWPPFGYWSWPTPIRAPTRTTSCAAN